MRYKFLKWLKRKVFKTPDDELPNKFTMMAYNILFPLRALYERQANVHYDLMRDTYTINGIKYARDVFSWMGRYAEEGDLFKFIKREGGYVTIKQIEPEQKNNYESVCNN